MGSARQGHSGVQDVAQGLDVGVAQDLHPDEGDVVAVAGVDRLHRGPDEGRTRATAVGEHLQRRRCGKAGPSGTGPPGARTRWQEADGLLVEDRPGSPVVESDVAVNWKPGTSKVALCCSRSVEARTSGRVRCRGRPCSRRRRPTRPASTVSWPVSSVRGRVTCRPRRCPRPRCRSARCSWGPRWPPAGRRRCRSPSWCRWCHRRPGRTPVRWSWWWPGPPSWWWRPPLRRHRHRREPQRPAGGTTTAVRYADRKRLLGIAAPWELGFVAGSDAGGARAGSGQRVTVVTRGR